MSDFIQYTQWKQREESLARTLEQSRATAERVAEDDRPSARRKAWLPAMVAAFRGVAADQR